MKNSSTKTRIRYSETDQMGVVYHGNYAKFIKSALYDDVLTIKTFLKKKPMVKIEFEYEITNQNNELICTGSSVLAFMDRKTMKPTRCPDHLLESLGY